MGKEKVHTQLDVTHLKRHAMNVSRWPIDCEFSVFHAKVDMWRDISCGDDLTQANKYKVYTIFNHNKKNKGTIICMSLRH